MGTDKDLKFEALLDYLKRSRGFDFTAYKRASLMRRVLRRMQTVGVQDYADYMDYLEVHADEFAQLFNTILINVTAFFRDEPAWDYVAQDVLPKILSGKSADEAVRVWSAGCASGEEAYTLAMLLNEALGSQAFHDRVKIYATDVDEEALVQARQGSYADRDLQSVPPGLRSKYFESVGGRYLFLGELRRSIIFGRHDLMQDAPISRLDLLVCRNTLMYFNAEAQSKILNRFHFALNETGFLFLGKAEMLLTHSNVFSPLDLKHRVFVKAPEVNLRDRLLMLAQTGEAEAVNHLGRHARLRQVAFEAGPVAQIVVDLDGGLTLVNERARVLFGLSPKDIGRPLQDLELSYRPVDLRSPIEQAAKRAERQVIKLPGVERHLPAGVQYLDVEVTPLLDPPGGGQGASVLGVSVTFDDVTQRQRVRDELLRSSQELETAYEELQSSNEELETTGEELQSTNEELETTNEELQSTNEELETMNEELRSTNEELETLNEELRQRTDDLNHANAFLHSILTSLHAGVVVVDRQLDVLVWNHRAEDLWGLRADEVQGRSLLTLDIGLPVEQLPISAFLSGQADYEAIRVNATNRRGRAVRCHITCTPFLGADGEREGVVLVMEEAEP